MVDGGFDWGGTPVKRNAGVHLLVYMVQLIFVVVLSFSSDEFKIEIDCRLAAIFDLRWAFKAGQQTSPGHEAVATNRYGHRYSTYIELGQSCIMCY